MYYCEFLFFCLLVFVLCIEVLLCWVHRCLQLLSLPLGLILDHYVVSFLISCNILHFKVYFVWYEDCYTSFLWFPFIWNIEFCPLSFGLYVSLGLKWVSCRYHICGSYCIHSVSLCLLVGAYIPLTFKVIIDRYDPVAVYFVVLGLSL